MPTPLLVRDYMNKAVSTLPDDAKLVDAVLLLRRTGKHHVPIVNSTGRVVGIISDRDIRLLTPSVLSPVGLDEQHRIFDETPISAAMTRNPVCVLADEQVLHAIELMERHRIQSVLVEEKGKLCGILTVAEVLKIAHKLLADQAQTQAAEAAAD
jgi:acetoin utilization protein AcuB